MTKKNIYLRATIWSGLFVFLTFLFSGITFAYQNHDLDEFDDLEKKSDNNNDKQRLNLIDDNLNLLNDDFDFGEEELELLKLELNPDDIETYREYEVFLNAFFKDSTLVRPNSFEKSSPPIIKEQQPDPISKNKIENLTPIDPNSFEKSNPPIIKEQQPDPISKNKIENLTPIDYSKAGWEEENPPIIKQEKPEPASTIKNQLVILPRIGFGLNYLASYNNIGPIIGGSISYGNNKMGNFGADLMYIVIPQDDTLNLDKLHTMGITGFYEKIILKNIVFKVGLSYLITGTLEESVGVAAGAGLSFPIGKMLTFQPMAELNFNSKTNNIFGLNLNIGISLGRDKTPSRNTS